MNKFAKPESTFSHLFHNKSRTNIQPVAYPINHHITTFKRILHVYMPKQFFFDDAAQINEPPHGKTNNLHMRNQRHRSASW